MGHNTSIDGIYIGGNKRDTPVSLLYYAAVGGMSMKEWAKGFYQSPAWRHARELVRRRAFGLCERCGRPGLIAHHRKYLTPKNIDNPMISLNLDNLEYLCLDCHNKEHEHFNQSADIREYEYDSEGNIVRVVDKLDKDPPGCGFSKLIL